MSSLLSSETALVLIEFQNEFLKPKGAFYEGCKAVIESTNMLGNTIALVKQARNKGVLILWVPISFAPDYREVSPDAYGILSGVVANHAFKKGEWGTEIVEELKMDEKDVIIEGKRGLCAFQSTNLEFILRNKGIKNVALGGFLTNVCVESTMRSAYERGFNVYTLTDCTATNSIQAQEATLKFNFPLFSHPIDSNSFLSLL